MGKRNRIDRRSVLVDRLFLGLEWVTTWSVEGTPALRFDSVWRTKDRRRAAKVIILFHPGFGKDEEVSTMATNQI